MNNSLLLGPFALPYAPLPLFAVVASGLFVGTRLGHKIDANVEPVRWRALLVGLVVARLAFVWEFRLAYMAALLLPGPALEPTPDLAFASLQSPEPLPLARLKGKPTVVNLWATWCPPCVREMPALQQAQREQPDMHFMFLNQGESAARVGACLQARDLDLHNMLLDPTRSAGAAFRQGALPTTLFFAADGRLVAMRIGELSAATLAKRLAAARQ